MAYLAGGQCVKCGKHFSEVVNSGQPIPTICPKCRTEDEEEALKIHLKSLSILTIEQRLEIIEKWIYNFKPYKELKY